MKEAEIILARRAVEMLSKMAVIPQGIFRKDLENAVECIEKQIPQKAILCHHCPRCEAGQPTPDIVKPELKEYAYYPEYCSWCGQKIDWSDEK